MRIEKLPDPSINYHSSNVFSGGQVFKTFMDLSQAISPGDELI
jgi:hypothetical protein